MTRSTTDGTSLSRTPALIGLLLVLLVAFGLRFTAMRADGGLWFDEIFGASYVNLPLLDVVIAVLRFDIHPPLYYLQLNAWGLLSKQDTWLLLNSVFWSLASIAVVYLGVAARAGRSAALLAAAFTALLGSEIYYASDLRMYAILGCNVLLLWWGVDQWLRHGRRGQWWALCLLVLSLSMLHSIAFVAVGSVLSYTVIRCWIAGERHRLKPLLGFIGISGVWLLPWLANASFRSVSHTHRPDFDHVAQTIGGWLLGYFPGATTTQYTVAAVLVLALVIYLLVSGSAYVRACVVSFVVLPVLVVGIISLVLRPIWLDRTLAYTAPFLAVALAVHLHRAPAARGAPARLGRRAGGGAAGLLRGLWRRLGTAAGAAQDGLPSRGPGHRAEQHRAARHLRAFQRALLGHGPLPPGPRLGQSARHPGPGENRRLRHLAPHLRKAGRHLAAAAAPQGRGALHRHAARPPVGGLQRAARRGGGARLLLRGRQQGPRQTPGLPPRA
ncbi:MAG: hypothetical protein KIT86_22235 [Hydrogenophaga sp.]|uniref:hypothetical protein n=1 Tax=Hydrogenophaga sp. TaxID=1904254 RepID=UPI002601AF6A|nr:hypothetical protein [Hydrogenophaga sp.]MCW5672388.1 hypothetical protein [Hydrogenophaga sp.]